MSSATAAGPIKWDQSMLAADQELVFINGEPSGVELASFSAELSDPQGVAVPTASGQHVPHVQQLSPDAPLSMAAWDITLGWKHVSEEVRYRALRIPAFASAGQLELVIDVPAVDFWLGDGSRTTHVLTRRTSHGTTGIPFVDRPDRVFVDGVELTVVDGAPASGECQSPFTVDSTSIVFGTAPASGALAELRHYPVLQIFEVTYSEEQDARNDWTVEVEARALVPLRDY